MKRCIVVALAVVAGCGKSGGPVIDQKGKVMFFFEGKQSVVEAEYGLKKEMTDVRMAGRKDADGTRHALVKKATFVTKPFSADGRDVTVDLGFDMGEKSGKLVIGGKTCELTMLSWGTGSVNDVKYEGFTGACKLDGEHKDFMVGLVQP